MTSGAPWSVKGIDPKAREIAKDLARRSGMTLGEWLNQVIFDDNADTPEGESSRRAAVASARPLSESRPPRRPGDELDQVLGALHELSRRFDASIDDQARNAARFEAAVSQLKADQQRAAERLDSVERSGGGAGGKAEALRSLEGALNKVAVHLSAGEERQRQSVADLRRELGEEMQRVADDVNRKVLEGENRSADAIAQVGAEVTRVAQAVEQRLRRADDSQAEALEKLGGEIARITERLSERIAAAERRSTSAVDDVGEQIARVTDRLHQRQERSESELAERMRQSEERTARLLEEGRSAIERGLARRDAVMPNLASGEPLAPEASQAPAVDEAPIPAFLEPPVLIYAHEEPPADIEADIGPEAAEPDLTVAAADAPLEEPPLTLDAGETDAEEANIREADAVPPDAEDDEETAEEVLRPSTLEMEARAALAADSPFARTGGRHDEMGSADLSGRRRSRKAAAMRGALLTGGAVAFTALAATGYVALHPDLAQRLSAMISPTRPIPVGPPSPPQPAAPPSQAAVALAATPTPVPKDPQADVEAMFMDAAAKVDANDPAGVQPLKTAASLGFAPAQRRLGKLYEDGGAGVAKDLAEGRSWTQRAAANGDPRGMHNLGLDYYEGSGGVRNLAVAAQWFQRAAEQGLRDSQFNLARFYEAGIGVKQDNAAAYRWYLIAARAGDVEAAARGEALKARLGDAERLQTEQAAAAFRPDPPAPPTSLAASLKTANRQQLALAQRALAKLGYYKGPSDGAASQSLGEAIQAYQHDRGQASNGRLSPELLQSFARISE